MNKFKNALRTVKAMQAVDNSKKVEEKEPPKTWQESGIYLFFKKNKKQIIKGVTARQLFKGDQNTYNETELEYILELMKSKQSQFNTKEACGAFYIKSFSTLKFLLDEQLVDVSKFNKVREMYSEITMENTLKLLIRCKLSFQVRSRLLKMFITVDEYLDEYDSILQTLETKEYNEENMQMIHRQAQNVIGAAKIALQAAAVINTEDKSNQGNQSNLVPQIIDQIHSDLGQLKSKVAEFKIKGAMKQNLQQKMMKKRDIFNTQKQSSSSQSSESDGSESSSGEEEDSSSGNSEEKKSQQEDMLEVLKKKVQEEKKKVAGKKKQSSSSSSSSSSSEEESSGGDSEESKKAQEEAKKAQEAKNIEDDAKKKAEEAKKAKKQQEAEAKRKQEEKSKAEEAKKAQEELKRKQEEEAKLEQKRKLEEEIRKREEIMRQQEEQIRKLEEQQRQQEQEKQRQELEELLRKQEERQQEQKFQAEQDKARKELELAVNAARIEREKKELEDKLNAEAQKAKEEAAKAEAEAQKAQEDDARAEAEALRAKEAEAQRAQEEELKRLQDLEAEIKRREIEFEEKQKAELDKQEVLRAQSRQEPDDQEREPTGTFEQQERAETSSIEEQSGKKSPIIEIANTYLIDQNMNDTPAFQLNNPSSIDKMENADEYQQSIQEVKESHTNSIEIHNQDDALYHEPPFEEDEEQPEIASKGTTPFKPTPQEGPSMMKKKTIRLKKKGTLAQRKKSFMLKKQTTYLDKVDKKGSPQSTMNKTFQSPFSGQQVLPIPALPLEKPKSVNMKHAKGRSMQKPQKLSTPIIYNYSGRPINQPSSRVIKKPETTTIQALPVILPKKPEVSAFQARAKSVSKPIEVQKEVASMGRTQPNGFLSVRRERLPEMNKTHESSFMRKQGRNQFYPGSTTSPKNQTPKQQYYNVLQAQISQRQHRFNQALQTASISSGLGKNEDFTTQFSNVWLLDNDGMYQDTSINSDLKRMKREQRSIEIGFLKEQKRRQRIDDRIAKENLVEHYRKKFGIMPTNQQVFFMNPTRLRDLLVKKATIQSIHDAATRIQRLFRRYKARIISNEQIKKRINAITFIQRRFKYWRENVFLPSKEYRTQVKKAFFIQRFLKGYQARRKVMKMVAEKKIQNLYDEYHPIYVVSLGNFQRRVRKAWFKYKERKEEKKRLKEEEAKKKGKYGRKSNVKGRASTISSRPSIKQPAPAVTKRPSITQNDSALSKTMVSASPSPNSINTPDKSPMSQTMTEQIKKDLNINMVVDSQSENAGEHSGKSQLPNLSPRKDETKLDAIEEKSVDDNDEKEIKIIDICPSKDGEAFVKVQYASDEKIDESSPDHQEPIGDPPAEIEYEKSEEPSQE